MDPRPKTYVDGTKTCRKYAELALSLDETLASLLKAQEDLKYFRTCNPNATGFHQEMFMRGYFATHKNVRVRG